MFRSGGGGTPGPAGPPGAAGAPGTPGQTVGNALTAGGGVVHTTNLDVIVSAAEYQINDVEYESAQTTLTIGAADVTNPRIDVIALNTSGAAVVVAGVAAATPFEPVLDPGTQLRLTAFTIGAGATSLTTANTIIFTEGGGESWTETASGAPISVASASSPITGSVSVEATSAVNGNYAQFANGSDFDTTTRNILAFTIKSKAQWANGKSLVVQWYDGTIARGTPVAIRTGAYGFNSSDTSTEQQLVVPMQAFAVAGLPVDTLRFTVTGGGAAIGFWLDDIYMQAGVEQSQSADALRYRGEYSSAVTYQLNDVVLLSSLLYTPLQQTLGNAPTNTTYWKPLTGGTTTSTQTGTSYTLLAADHGTIVRFTNASDIEVTVPTGLRSDFNVRLTPTSTGRVHVIASGTTINAPFYRHRIGPANLTGVLRGTASNTFTLDGAINIPNPLTITGCVFWMDASDGNSVTQASGLISQVNDLSGSAFHLTQGTGTNQPTYRYGDCNGRNAIRFDGVDNFLLSASATLLRNITGYSVFVVYRALSATPAAAMAMTSVSNATNTKFSLGLTATTGLRQMPTVRRVAADSGAGLNGTQTAVLPTILTATVNHSTTTGFIYANGTQIATSTSFGTSGTADNVGGSICVGAGIDGAAGWFGGDIMEVIYYNVVVSTADRNRVEGYLANKWNIDIA